MKLQDLIKTKNTSLEDSKDIDGNAYGRDIRHLAGYKFWPGEKSKKPKLWSHQVTAISLATAYLRADRRLPKEGIANEAALVKMATGTGKSAVITVLCRCLPQVKRVLVLTPREALTDQLYRYVRSRFWVKTMGFKAEKANAIFHDDGTQTGKPVPIAHITKLLPSEVTAILNAEKEQERLVLVGTLQALDQIRRTATSEPSEDEAEETRRIACKGILDLIASFDLVVVDEGHYEPAISWSRAIRDADVPTILFSATPYRNDYKSFRVRGRFVFNQPVQDALGAKVIRSPVFVALDDVPANEEPGPLVTIKSAGSGSEDTVRVQPLTEREKADLAAFVRNLKKAVQDLPSFPDLEHPKIIVRADDARKLEVLQDEIERICGERALMIHHAQKKNDNRKRRYITVKAAYASEENNSVRYWLHQTKLLEGVDDPSFVAVAIYDAFGNARQLVQQIGRVLRSSDPKRKLSQRAFILAEPKRLKRMEESWKNYLEFEVYCAERTQHVVVNEVALPDRLLRELPDIQYVEGQFRPKFMLVGGISSEDIRLPASAAIFELDGDELDMTKVRKEIEEAILNEDRFQPIEIRDLPEDAFGLAYYGWRTSPLLTRQFFPEWTLGVCILIKDGNLVLAHDTQGIVFDGAKLGLGRMGQNLLTRAIPCSSDELGVRVSRMSTASLDMSDKAIRTQATRTRSFEDTFTDLLDPGMVATSAYGFIGGRGRYLGFARSRIRDAFPEPLALDDYVAWVRQVCSDLRAEGRVRNPVFDRYARLSEPLTKKEAEPKSILIDLGDSFHDFAHDTDETRLGRTLSDADLDDLCADVEDQKFEISIDGKRFTCEIEFVERTNRYRIKSVDLDKHFLAKARGEGRQSSMTFTQIINRAQAFRVIPDKRGVVYASGKFYRPQGFDPRADGTIPQLQNVTSVPALGIPRTEKGEKIYGVSQADWATQSVFGLIKAMADHPVGSPVPDGWGELGERIAQFDLIVCDDDGQEVGDFLAVDSKTKRACIIHAKASKTEKHESIGGLEAVGRQALASLAFCATTALPPKIAEKRWDTDVNANGKRLKGLKRIFKNADGHKTREIVKIVQDALTNRAWTREIWIVAASILDRRQVEDSIRGGMTNRNWQLLMYLDSLTTACARGNARLQIFCHSSSPPVAASPRNKKRAKKAKSVHL